MDQFWIKKDPTNSFRRPENPEDIRYRKIKRMTFEDELKSALPKSCDLCFHGTTIWNTKAIIESGEIKNFFDNLGEINTFTEAVSKGEIAFNEHLQKCGFTYSAYIEETKYLCAYLGTMSLPYDKPTALLLLGCPLVKKKAYDYMLPYEKVRLEYILEKLK